MTCNLVILLSWSNLYQHCDFNSWLCVSKKGFENGNAIVYKAMGYDITSYDMIARYVIAEPVYEDAETLIVGERYSAQEIEKRKNDQKRLSAYRSLVFWAYPELRRGDRRPLPACTYLFVRAMFNSLDEDVWADYNHTVYAERVVGDNDI